jgi:DNA-binding response OmpR family regulator
MAANAKTVLIIDDDKLVLAMYKFAFEDHGYRVLLADDGNAGLRALEAQTVDVVFLDILMPEKEGLETLLEIKQRFPEVAVFVMSGGGMRGKHDFLTVAKKFGATGVVRKPATPKELIALIDALPAKHAAPETNQRIA